MVDAHSHVTLPGGSHWIDRGADPPEELLEVAEHNGNLLGRAGVRWARDVGSPLAVDPRDGRRRALALRVRERWRSDPNRPRIRVAGTWIGHSGVLTGGLAVEADDGPALLKAASTQLDDGADFLKLYLDGPKKEEAPWSTEDVRAVVELAHGRGAKVTAHSGFLVGARVGIDAGVDSLEHGFELDSDAVATMASSQGRRSRPQQSAGESCSRKERPVASLKAGPPISSSSTVTHLLIRRPFGGSGEWPG